MSGTSMATPAVAGAVACVMGTSPSSSCRYTHRHIPTYGKVCMDIYNHATTQHNSSSSAFSSKLRNPRVSVSQPGGSTKPLTYLASNSTVRCP